MTTNDRIVSGLTRRHAIGTSASLGILALAGCASDPVPRDTFYRLGEPATPVVRAGGPLSGVAEVPPLRAAGIVNERAILYRDGPRQLAQYSYHAWSEAPALMLQQSLIGVLRQAQVFDAIVSPEMRLNRDFEFWGDIRQWEHVRGVGQGSAAIEVEISVRRLRGNRQLLSKTYRADEPA